jgi:hypothetical protein
MLPRPWLGLHMQFDRLKRREFITPLGTDASFNIDLGRARARLGR